MIRSFDLDGIRLAAEDGGAGATALVFLHYWGGSSRTWAPVIGRLEGRHRCIALDQRGWGASTHDAGDFGLDAMADDVERLVAALDVERFVLIGHSMGGKVAQIVAARRPAGLAGLVLVAPAPLSPAPVPADRRAAMLASYQSEAGVRAALEILAATRLPPELAAQVIADTLGGAPGAKRAWTETEMIADRSDRAARIATPTLIVVGTEDRVEPPALIRAEVVARIAGASLMTIPACGHLAPLEAPDALAAAVAAFVRDRIDAPA